MRAGIAASFFPDSFAQALGHGKLRHGLLPIGEKPGQCSEKQRGKANDDRKGRNGCDLDHDAGKDGERTGENQA